MKGTSRHDTRTEASRGTAGYRAPELVMGDSFGTYNHKTDIYALGCVISEIITGKRFSETDMACAEDVEERKKDSSRFPIPDKLLIDARSKAVVMGCLQLMLHGNSKLRPPTATLLQLHKTLENSETTVWLDACLHPVAASNSLPDAIAALTFGIASAGWSRNSGAS